MLGTATYMAPEQLENHAVGPSADVWSLGIVLLECLTGKRVYAGTPSEVLARRMAGPLSLPDDLPVPWRLLLTGMLAPTPDDRLSALDVSTMLATPAFRAPWVVRRPSSDVTTIVGDPRRRHEGGQDGETSIVAAAHRTGGVTTSEPKNPNRIATRVDRPRSCSSSSSVGSGSPSRWVRRVRRPHDDDRATTTSAPTTTTTTLPSISHSLTNLVNDVVAGQSAHAIGPQVAQSISSGSQQAVTDLSSGNAQAAASDLQGVATALANGLANHYVTPAYGTILQADLKTLANALGLSAAATPSSSTTTTSTTTTFTSPNERPGKGNGPP